MKRDQLQLERSRGELHQSFANWCSFFLRKKLHQSLQKTAEADELKTRVKELETPFTTTRALARLKITSLQTGLKTVEEQPAESRSAHETQE